MEIKEILERLKSLKKHDASSNCFGEVHHEEYDDGFWISKEEVDQLISDIENS